MTIGCPLQPTRYLLFNDSGRSFLMVHGGRIPLRIQILIQAVGTSGELGVYRLIPHLEFNPAPLTKISFPDSILRSECDLRKVTLNFMKMREVVTLNFLVLNLHRGSQISRKSTIVSKIKCSRNSHIHRRGQNFVHTDLLCCVAGT
jgi:hypothetical protein